METKINEIFLGIQGEGKTMGQPRLFIRFSGCNLFCKYCDTKYHSQINSTTDIQRILLKTQKYWCITGGEPLLQQDQILTLINFYRPYWVEIETNGTIQASEELLKKVNLWNVSPKNKKDQVFSKIVTPILLQQKLKDFIVKLVYTEDIDFIQSFWDHKERIYIMPQATTRQEIINKAPKLVDFCLIHNLRFCPRLHILLWDNKKGI